MQKPRRDFLKITAAGAAGLAIARADKAMAAWPGTGTLAVNPNISNMRVVACVDPKMMKTPANMSFAAENAAVDAARLQANMDAMAMQLANQPSADAAWKAIFRSSKPWASTKVAIKVNAIENKNMARVAVVQKFCTVLAGLGVLPANIIIYDGQATYATGGSYYTSFFAVNDASKTAAVVSTNNSALGGTTSAAIPGGTSANCTADIAKGNIDILINIANNKGHDLMGRATLSMKNHFGTFAPKHDINYLFNINKSDAILGGDPVRQQLCFIDSLLANKTSNMGIPEVMPNYLVMGVFAPAVDYLTIKKVREEVMGCTHDAATITSYLTTFGYTAADPVWVLVPPAGSTTIADGGAGGAGGSGGAGSGGATASGGAGSGGASASGGARTGGNDGSGGSDSGGITGSGGADSGGVSASGGAGSGGATASGGARSNGGEASGGATGNGGTSAGPASGGSIAMGGHGASTTAHAAGGSAATATTSSQSTASGSSGGCAVAGADRKATHWGAALTLGAVVVQRLRRLLRDDDHSS